MGQRVTKICDRCKEEFDAALGPPLRYRGVKISVVSHKDTWGDPLYLVGWQGELCDSCHTIVVDRLIEVFNKLMNIEEPTIELPSAKAVTQPLRKRRKP